MVIAGAAACNTFSAGTCAILVIGGAASANHLYSDVSQIITDKDAKSALVLALVGTGMSESDAETYQAYAGVVMVTTVEGGVRFATHRADAAGAADDLARLEGQTFDAAGEPGSTTFIAHRAVDLDDFDRRNTIDKAVGN
ncbi:hypothetical protein [Allorhizobium taibaishanense]|uniref:Uncharacterized protein n=1 Tax=Allorhizobium taibaishanense TaxID=887144 RepID=A0A1Q9A989_9HYPH|nr:hypothetical protein [Allorhizobium taibaishanense]MBB4009791.1 hypothetical protein [Allorhizobium taibaishanense]OLP51440.1 hypothetical protein BJF91_15380 [Allorhizobium taibaishanense]